MTIRLLAAIALLTATAASASGPSRPAPRPPEDARPPLTAPAKADTVSAEIRYRQGYSRFDAALHQNAEKLDRFVRAYKAQDAPLPVTIVASASPEGSLPLQQRLARRRGETLRQQLVNRGVPAAQITVKAAGIDWPTLYTHIAADRRTPAHSQACQLLKNPPVADRDATIKRRLLALAGGRTWRYAYSRYFPAMRHARATFIVAGKEVEVEVIEEPEPEPQPEPPVVVEPQPEPQPLPAEPQKSPFYWAVKTNMLYDVLGVPAVGLELSLGRRWTLSADWMYSWWSKDSKHDYWRLYGGGLELRKYFGSKAKAKPLQGHHLGLYGQLFTYDFELGGKGQMGGKPGGNLWQRCNYQAGAIYGYSLPIGYRLNIDFGIGIGYWGGRFEEYKPVDGHYVWTATKERHWFGPTRAEISLVWLLGRGNTNPDKAHKPRRQTTQQPQEGGAQ